MKLLNKLIAFSRKCREFCQQIYFHYFTKPRKTSRFFILIVGTPGSGKTTLSYALSETLHHPLVEFHPHDPEYHVFFDRIIHAEKGCILGDIPQKLDSVKRLQRRLDPDPIFCVYVKTDPNICIRRALARNYCPRCHRTYLLEAKECEECHTPLRKRDRYGFPLYSLLNFKSILEKKCVPYFKVRNPLMIVDGSLPKDEILSLTLKQVKKWSHHHWKLDFQ